MRTLPVLGMLQRGGVVVIQMVSNVQHVTIRPIIIQKIAPGTPIYTDEYDIYDALPTWGYAHKTVNYSLGEYARDEGGNGFHEVHVNTLEGFWSLLRSWLRPRRGISQEKLPCYLGVFEYIHNVRRSGKTLLHSLLATLVNLPYLKVIFRLVRFPKFPQAVGAFDVQFLLVLQDKGY